MSRGLVPSLATPSPLGRSLPGIYQEDSLTQRITDAFDQVLAPIFSTLDDFPAYLDPALAPEDFLDWLGGWVGVLLDETWPLERRRAFVAQGVELYRKRGTVEGLADQVRVFTSGDVEIAESGGAAWSTTNGAAIPGRPDRTVLVRVRAPRGTAVDEARLDALVAAAKPANVVHRVEIAAG